MRAKQTAPRSSWGPALTRAIGRRLAQLGIFTAVQAAVLFLAAGRLDWAWAWVYCGIYLAEIGLNAALILPRHPDLVAERGQMAANVKGWDKVFTLLYTPACLALLLVAGLDQRFGWTPAAAAGLPEVGLLGLLGGWALVSWAMAVNQFFSSFVRVQTERGHQVISAGPYAIVRHPGYVGMSLAALSTAVLLGSQWALLPAALLIGLVAGRTRLEDATLQRELPGYAAYAQRVRYRLLPGIW